MKTALLLLLVTGLTLIGDYCIKIASGRIHGLYSVQFAVGVIFYSLPAIGWFYLMKSHSLATIGVLYSVSTILLLALLGIVVFNEPVGWREGLGIFLAVAAVIVVTYR